MYIDTTATRNRRRDHSFFVTTRMYAIATMGHDNSNGSQSKNLRIATIRILGGYEVCPQDISFSI